MINKHKILILLISGLMLPFLQILIVFVGPHIWLAIDTARGGGYLSGLPEAQLLFDWTAPVFAAIAFGGLLFSARLAIIHKTKLSISTCIIFCVLAPLFLWEVIGQAGAVGVGNLTFYDPGWLWVDALVLISVAILPLLAIALAYYAVKRWRPKYAKRTLLAARIAWTTTGVAIVIILFIVDILRRPDWVPFITHVS